LAKEIDGEIINADARQIYKEITIISGKDTGDSPFTRWKKVNNWDIGYQEIQGIKLWLTNITTISESFSSFDYTTLAKMIITDIWKRGKTPIIVGGTYLYIHQLLYGSTVQQPPNILLREALKNKTVAELQAILQNKYISVFNLLNNSDKNNPHRLIRKIEIGPDATTGFSSFTVDPFFKNTKIDFVGFTHAGKVQTIQAIEKRVIQRIKNGALVEAKNIQAMNFAPSAPGLQTLGYKQLISVLEKKMTIDEAQGEWIQKETQYAKRQLTFMKKNPNILWRNSPSI